jgi:hypothetical protein
MAAPAYTGLHLLAPRSPGGRGDQGRWQLHMHGPGGGELVALYGPRFDDVEGAKLQASERLGYDPDWQPVEAKFPGWPACFSAEAVA